MWHIPPGRLHQEREEVCGEAGSMIRLPAWRVVHGFLPANEVPGGIDAVAFQGHVDAAFAHGA